MKRLAVAFSGPSNSGKTTLITKVAQKFIKDGLKVLIIKHDPADKALFDTPGKDSFKFSQTGADVMVLSPTRTTFFSRQKADLDRAIAMARDFDVLLVEGLKTLPLPRIGVFRGQIDDEYLPFLSAVASYENRNFTDAQSLNLDNLDAICEWIKKNAKEL